LCPLNSIKGIHVTFNIVAKELGIKDNALKYPYFIDNQGSIIYHLLQYVSNWSKGLLLLAPCSAQKMRNSQIGGNMKTLKSVLILAISLALVLVVVQNRAPVQAHFLWLTAEVPTILLLFLTVAGGFVLGLLIALFMKRGIKSN
jgi:uncharacterized integral membrane protein